MTLWLDDGDVRLYHGDALDVLAGLEASSVQTCVTSPPYWGLRDYGSDGQLGLEVLPELYIANLGEVVREVRRVLRDDGTLWLNLGDSYASDPGKGGSGTPNGRNGRGEKYARPGGEGWQERLRRAGGLKPKDLVGIPWRVAFALQADGWYLRSAITWCKGSPMPESVTDRPTKATEMIFLLSKQPRYFFDQDAVREESGANLRDFWVINPQPFSAGALFGGTVRTTSADCPVHGDRSDQVATAPHDGHEATLGSHSAGTDDRPALTRLRDSVPTVELLEPVTAGGSSDSLAPSRAASATPHSSGSHRTAPALATSPAYTAAAQTTGHTVDTSASRESGALFDHIPESSSAVDAASNGSAIDPSGRTPLGTSGKCTCRILDHFATYPEALVRRCILAGTSEAGGCAECGAPWVRQVERTPMVIDRSSRTHDRGQTRSSGTMLEPATSTTTGWAPSCDCGSPFAVPQTVLDPFVGSGTTALVARKQGRRAIGIDLSEPYLEIAARRLGQQSLFAAPVVGSGDAG